MVSSAGASLLLFLIIREDEDDVWRPGAIRAIRSDVKQDDGHERSRQAASRCDCESSMKHKLLGASFEGSGKLEPGRIVTSPASDVKQ